MEWHCYFFYTCELKLFECSKNKGANVYWLSNSGKLFTQLGINNYHIFELSHFRIITLFLYPYGEHAAFSFLVAVGQQKEF